MRRLSHLLLTSLYYLPKLGEFFYSLECEFPVASSIEICHNDGGCLLASGEKPFMEEQKSATGTAARAVPVTDDDLRLQNLVAGWEGVSRGETLSVLHQECLQTAGPRTRSILPAQLVLVQDLDATTLETALAQRPLSSYQAALNFRVPPVGRFDAVSFCQLDCLQIKILPGIAPFISRHQLVPGGNLER